MALSEFAKKASDQIPYCKDQGIDYVLAGPGPGYGSQGATVTKPSGGVVTFASMGLKNMADASYQVLLINHTNGANVPLSAYADRTAKQLVITGAADGDVVDVVVWGHLAGVSNR